MGKRYKNPPLVEALCEFYFQGSHWDDAVPGLLYEKIKPSYPQRRQLEQVGVKIDISAESESITKKRGQPRIQFVSDDKSRLVQMAKDLLVVNHLKPYPQFEKWEPDIEAILKEYVSLTQPSGIARFGVRYINNIVLPYTSIRMEDYFRIYPQLPEAVGQSHGPFMLRIEIPGKTTGHRFLATFGNSAPQAPDSLAFMLDLYDIYDGGMPLECKNIHDEIRKAHDNVETVFESAITDKLRDLFEEVKNGDSNNGKS
ncbi:MAG: TIGR04255 family protein [Proteobacteria bacterium]|nr:TIGR04255 family protein [Pseudomonadota bacterium]